LLFLSGDVSTSSTVLNPSSDMSCFAIKFLSMINKFRDFRTTHRNNDLKSYGREPQKTEKETKTASC